MIKRILALALCAAMMLSVVACTTTGQPQASEAPDQSAQPQTSAQPSSQPEDDKYVTDGTFRYLYSSEISTMNYLKTGTTADFKPSANFVDTLIEYNEFGVAQPCLATGWSESDDGLVWTLNLRQGVKWYTNELDEYAEVTANDFVYGLQWILTPANESSNVDIVCSVIQNAREYFDGAITDFSQVGVKAVDDYTLEYTLSDTCPYFLSMLTYVAFMPVNQQFVEEFVLKKHSVKVSAL